MRLGPKAMVVVTNVAVLFGSAGALGRLCATAAPSSQAVPLQS